MMAFPSNGALSYAMAAFRWIAFIPIHRSNWHTVRKLGQPSEALCFALGRWFTVAWAGLVAEPKERSWK
jgi:hypothetical protein